MKILQNLQPKLVFEYFEEISKIPRGSGNEKGISDYLASFGKKLGLETIQDDALNIIIKKPASKGYENAPTVILQGHMDMVCEKNKGTEHDFENDPLKLRIIEDDIYATDTTLGADNGIAVAYCMAILADNTIEHPALEVILTTDEETGMTGAMNLSKDHVNGTMLINLDSEVEGELLVSCAGGIRIRSILNIEREEKKNDREVLEVKVRGLKGGHSGMEIHKGRGSANKLMGRLLKELFDKYDIRLINLEGGSKNNAIPREADAIIAVLKDNINDVISKIKEYEEIFKHELKVQDPDINIEIKNRDESYKIFTEESTKNSIDLLYLYPNGVNTMNMAMEGLTESSTNLGVIRTLDDAVEYNSDVRSSVASLKDEIVKQAKTLTLLVGGKFIAEAGYPEWEYSSESKLRELCVNIFEKMYGKKPKIVAIHAGIECGLFGKRLGNLDMISFGPNLYDVHTPNEHMSITSVQHIWEYLLQVLKNIK